MKKSTTTLAGALFALALSGTSHAQGLNTVVDVQRCDEEKYKNTQLAIQYCDRALRNPDALSLDDLTRALIARGQAYARANDIPNALRDYAQAIKSNPFKGDAHFHRGMLYADNLDDPDRAIPDLTESMKLGYGTNLSFRGRTYFRKGDFDSAIADLTKSLQTNADQAATTRKDLADVWRGKGDFQRAISEYTEAINLATQEPTRVSFLWSRAATYFNAGRFDKAEADMIQVQKSQPRHAGYAYYLELIARRKGGRGSLLETASQLDASPPASKVVDLLLNKATPADVLRAFEAPVPSDAGFKWLKRSRMCSANFLIGQHMLTQGMKHEAMTYGLFRTIE